MFFGMAICDYDRFPSEQEQIIYEALEEVDGLSIVGRKHPVTGELQEVCDD